MESIMERSFTLCQQKQNHISSSLTYNSAKNREVNMQQKKTREILANNVSNLMEALNISAAEVERRSNGGITARMVGYILKAEKSAGVDIIEALGYSFKIQPSMLLSEMAKEDIEHLRLIASLSAEERQEVTQYANFILQKRSTPDS